MNLTEIEDRFMNLTPETRKAIHEYQTTRDPKLVRPIVDGIIEKYLPPEVRNRSPEAMKALNSFGVESITLMEIILDIQDALGLDISDAELRSLHNFDEATKLLSEKVAALSPSGSAKG
jgi:acyl carrier protein